MVIAGERMERVTGDRGASAGRPGGHPAEAQPHSDLRMLGLRIELILNFNAPRLSKRLHRFTM